MRRALILKHVPFEDLGSLGDVLFERGFSLEVRDVCIAENLAADEAMAELLVVLGGPIGVYETTAYPFLEGEIALIRARLQRGAPTLGICLGAQLMAAALGAAVHPGGRGKEIGWSPLNAGRSVSACPPIAELLSPGIQVLHWHGDTFDLPQGAAHLAATGLYENQAFSIGRHALALQFHPEVTATGLERWYVGHCCELAAARIDIAELRAKGRLHAPKLRAAAIRFWNLWLDTAMGAAGRDQPSAIRSVT